MNRHQQRMARSTIHNNNNEQNLFHHNGSGYQPTGAPNYTTTRLNDLTNILQV